MEVGVPQQLQELIYEELISEAIYRELASIAPNEEHQRLLLELAAENRGLAIDFSRILYDLVGYSYNPELRLMALEGNYEDNLRKCLLRESESFRNYDRNHFSANSYALKSAYYKARTDHNVHTTRLLYLLNK